MHGKNARVGDDWVAHVDMCRRPSAVVNLNCVTNRVAPGSRYKLSYGAEQYKTIHPLLDILYLQPPHPTVLHDRTSYGHAIQVTVAGV